MVAQFVFRQFHYSDIKTFIEDGEIRSKNKLPPQLCHQTSYADLVNLRASFAFSLPGGGVVNDYVPFYFSPITSFCFTIHKGNVDVIDPGGRKIGRSNSANRAFVVFSIEKLTKSNLYVCFSDLALNTQAPIPTVIDDLCKLPFHIDWSLFDDTPKVASIPEIGYSGVCKWFQNRPTPTNHQLRSTKRMAEFLVRDAVPIRLAECIVVENSTVGAQVEALMKGSTYSIPVYVKPGCFCK